VGFKLLWKSFAVYLKNGKRWQNFPLLSGRIFGITKIRSELAVLADDLNFLPSSSRQQSTPTRPLESEELATAGRAEPAPHSVKENNIWHIHIHIRRFSRARIYPRILSMKKILYSYSYS
jgi:hypothetical protein